MAKIKIPADVSALRKKFAEAAARRKMQGKPKEEVKVGDRKAGQEAADARKKARLAEQTVAEKDLRIKELEDAIADREKKLAEAEPLAKRYSDLDHKRREREIAKFPKEEQAKVRKLEWDAIEMLVQARGFDTNGAGATGTNGKVVGPKWTNMEELSALAKTDPTAYNKGIDDVAKGVIKMDKEGRVV